MVGSNKWVLLCPMVKSKHYENSLWPRYHLSAVPPAFHFIPMKYEINVKYEINIYLKTNLSGIGRVMKKSLESIRDCELGLSPLFSYS